MENSITLIFFLNEAFPKLNLVCWGWVPKKIWLLNQNLGPKKNFSPEKKNLIENKFWLEKNLGPEKNVGPEKNLGP